jgi:hypothetical protein
VRTSSSMEAMIRSARTMAATSTSRWRRHERRTAGIFQLASLIEARSGTSVGMGRLGRCA